MRKGLTLVTLAAASLAVAVCSACSNGSSASQGPTSTIPSAGMSRIHSLSGIAQSGVAKVYDVATAHHLVRHHVIRPLGGAKHLFVDDNGLNAVDVLANNSWNYLTDFSTNIDGPDGNWADKTGNVYVANYRGANITEYSKTGSYLFTYDNGVTNAVGVTSDKNGNVYEADYSGRFVQEFDQQSNVVVGGPCYPGGFVEGVAVDANNNVFVDFSNGSGGYIEEFSGGLSGCSGTTLGASVTSPGGMVLDKHGNLVICDQVSKTVDIIAPPYSSVTRTLGSGYTEPFHVTINKKNKQAYVADAGTGEVTVWTYPRGSLVATLGSVNQINFALGAVDGANYVPY
jgi:hypothetical protein